MSRSTHSLGDQTIGLLSEALKPCPLPEGIAQRLSERLQQAVGARPRPAIKVQRAEDGRWISIMPGVEVRILHHNASTGHVTSLWRLAAGATLPAHDHQAEEECLIIDGDIRHQGHCYRAGDYMIGSRGSHHGEISSRDGGTMLLRGSDQHLPAAVLASASLV